MDRTLYHHPSERPFGQNQTAPPPASQASPFLPPTAQPPIQIPFSDPFHTNRDPFLGGGRRGSLGPSSRAWPLTQGNADLHPQQQHPQHSPVIHSIPHSQPLPPPPPNGLAMSSYDEMRRRSLGAAGSPPQYARGPLEPPPPPPPSFPARNMPPPSPPQNAPSTSSHHGSAPRGPPTASPFAGVRDIGSSHRPGMSISAILGGGEERKPNGSPHSSHVAPTSTPKSMQPPSPGRARSSSMREGSERGFRGLSPPRGGVFGEPARTGSEPRREGIFGSPQFRREPPAHSFRAFQHPPQEQSHIMNGYGAPMRPNSQPVEAAGPRSIEEMNMREVPPSEARAGTFRHFGEPPMLQRNDALQRHERPPFQQNDITSHPQERAVFHSPSMDRERLAQGPMRFQPTGSFGNPIREEQTSLFRPAYQQPTSHPVAEAPRESIEGRAQDMRRQLSRPTPPNELSAYDRGRNEFADRPMTLEEHQRMGAIHREQQRKESDSSVHRALLNISPEINRRGRNSPLPQAVQGAQPRHVGPGGDNPGIKMEFGRMFSGLGSGVGSVTPGPHHHQNGTTTPSRMSPSRYVESGDLVRSAVAELDERRGGSKAGSRASRRNGRRSRDDDEHIAGEGRNTPDAQRGNKRAKTNNTAHHHHHVHPHHHHHHHHHEQTESPAGPFNMPRFPSNPLSHANLAANQAHHHHHHHHAHPGHHHHHPPRTAPAPRKPSTAVLSKRVIDESANKLRKHLGSQLYTTEVSLPPAAGTPIDAKIKFSSKMKPIPVFEGRENCTFTVRVPRYYLTSSEVGPDDYSLEEICKRRQLWGTDIYTDDSDVVAAAVHSGWIKGDFGEYNEDLHDICDITSEQEGDDEVPISLSERPRKPVKVPEGFDAHITLLVLPPLESYASTNQHHIWSREWRKTHDGMSYMIHSIDFVDEGASSRFAERGAAARKNRIALEEANRREAAAGLLMFANGHGAGTVRVGA